MSKADDTLVMKYPVALQKMAAAEQTPASLCWCTPGFQAHPGANRQAGRVRELQDKWLICLRSAPNEEAFERWDARCHSRLNSTSSGGGILQLKALCKQLFQEENCPEPVHPVQNHIGR